MCRALVWAMVVVLMLGVATTVATTEAATTTTPDNILWTLTSMAEDGGYRLTDMEPLAFDQEEDSTARMPSADAVIEVDTSTRYQVVEGFGSSLEGSTCYNLARMSASQRQQVLGKLLTLDDDGSEDGIPGIGFNLMRLTIGTSDYCPQPFYSYDDMPPGEADMSLEHFSTAADAEFIVPMIQEAKAIAGDDLRFFASPWSGPGFLKTSDSLLGGQLKDDDDSLATYAAYLERTIAAYRDDYGIDIFALTPQNEPLANSTYPSTIVTAELEATLIGKHLGPLLASKASDQKDGRAVQIWAFDHNWDTLFYPRTILSDPDAEPYVQGTGFHGYGGKPSAMSTLHDEFPAHDIYFTEKSMYRITGAATIVDIFRNWSRSYSAWVTMLDTNLQPNSGPFVSNPTMLLLDVRSGDEHELDVLYNLEYFIYGQFSRYVRRGAQRVDSDTSAPQDDEGDKQGLRHVAFIDESTSTVVLIVVNESTEDQSFILQYEGKTARAWLPGAAMATYRWHLL